MAAEKQGKIIRILLILIVLLVVGIYGILKVVRDTKSSKDKFRDIIPTSNSEILKVKGFYIGMSIDEAVKILNEKYKDVLLPDGRYEVGVYKGETPPAEQPVRIRDLRSEGFYGASDDTVFYCFDHFVSFRNMVDYPIHIEADKSGKVILIEFNREAVDKLFNVEDMDAKSFAQAFINNYSIPELTPSSDIIPSSDTDTDIIRLIPFFRAIKTGWFYISDRGFKVIITEDKELMIQKVASSEERKFN